MEKYDCFQFRLAHCPQEHFETISYCWGDVSHTTQIEVNGMMLVVPTTASKALQQVRLLEHDRTIWIDSVCINQEDIQERSQQVSTMHAIYSEAVRNLVCLGEDDGTVGQALDTFRALENEARQESNDYATFKEMTLTQDSALRFSSTGPSFSFDSSPVIRFLSRPWFYRLWVIQEVALAKSNLCYCGTYSFDLHVVLRASQWLMYKRFHLPFRTSEYPGFDMVSRLADIIDPDIMDLCRKLNRKRATTLAGLLRVLRSFTCRDPKDHVYGLLGLYQHWVSSDNLPVLLQPDYQKPLAQIFTDATRRAIHESNSLEALSSVHHRQQSDEVESWLPSWVPRWVQRFDMDLDPLPLGTSYEVSGKTAWEANETSTDNGFILTAKGFFIDSYRCARVVKICDVPIVNSEFVALLDVAADLVAKAEIPKEAMAMTLLAGYELQQEATNPTMALQDYNHLREYMASLNGKPSPIPLFDELNSESEVRQRANLYWARYLDACCRRRLFMTEGRRLGLGPQTMEDGDFAVILFGSDCPLVLRSRGARYQLVGPCYVYGTADGEALAEHRARGDVDVRFEIE